MGGGERVLRGPWSVWSVLGVPEPVGENSPHAKAVRSPMPEVLALACYLDWFCTLCDLIFVGLLDGRISQTDV